MTSGTDQYLTELADELSFHPERVDIIEEYRGHVNEMENDLDTLPSYDALVFQLGEPRSIASVWKEETSITQSRLQWLFVCCNVLLFIGGMMLTLGYHLFEWTWLQWTWRSLTSIPMVIVLMYFAFWGLLGYEIGKTFGARGQKVLRKTFVIGMIPNVSLMALTIFRIIPHDWFDPLITRQFILLCVIATILLYPVSWMGYRWGRRMSV